VIDGLRPLDGREVLAQAEILLDGGDPNAACALLEPLAGQPPRRADVLLLLARASFASARLRRAEELFAELADRDPSDHYALHALGRTLQRQGRHREAVGPLRMAAAMRPCAEYEAAAADAALRAVAR
jgi:Flp pilus assembly protein TadD